MVGTRYVRSQDVGKGGTMDAKLLGIHHVTAIPGDPQKNVDFYVRVLRLTLV